MSCRSTTDGAAANDGVDHGRGPSAVLSFGSFRLDLEQRRLLCIVNEGEQPIPLGSRAFDLLLLLARRPGALISKDELIDSAWPGVTVEENNLSVQISALRRALGDGHNDARFIETVPGRGYRFLPTVATHAKSAPALPAEPSNDAPSASQTPIRRLRLHAWHAAIAVVAIVATVAGVLVTNRAGAPNRPDARPALSMVVLPFTTGGADQAYDYVAEAITDDLTTKIAAIDGAFVIARGTARAFRGQTDNRSIAAQLNVRYVLEGSARPLGELTRVNVRLMEADSGATIWSGQFDSAIVGLAAAQDDAVNRIAAALGSRMVDTEARRLEREHSVDPSAVDLTLRARSILNLPQNAERNERATVLLRQALERDPRSVEAMTRLGDLLITRWTLVRDRAGSEQRTAEARMLLNRAAAINPRSFGVLVLRAMLFRVDGDWEDATVAFREVSAVQPSWSPAYNQLALCALMLGQPEEAVQLLQRALQLDPMAPDIHTRYALMGEALLMLGRNEEAVTWLRRAVQAFPPPQTMYRDILAAALAQAGHRAQAEEELRRALDRSPCMTVQWVRHRSEPYSVRTYWNTLADGLALAGLRDNATAQGRVPSPTDHCGEAASWPPGVNRLSTEELQRMIAADKPPPVLLSMFHADVAIPGTVWISPATIRPDASAAVVTALRQKLEQLTGGDRNRQIVVIPWNIETSGRQPLSAMIASLGYKRVYSYSDGLEAWITHDLAVETRDYRESPTAAHVMPP